MKILSTKTFASGDLSKGLDSKKKKKKKIRIPDPDLVLLVIIPNIY